jgi:hypothetical protein
MSVKTYCLQSLLLVASVLAANSAWALGHGLGQTKEELKLDYEVVVKDHGTGRVSIELTIADLGRLGPLNSIQLVIPSKDGTGHVDLSLSLATSDTDGKLVARAHLIRGLAERAQIQLRTSALDGKQELLTWYYHTIPIAKHFKDEDER